MRNAKISGLSTVLALGLAAAAISAIGLQAHHTGGENGSVIATGMASFYARKFEGRRTANGETFRNSKMTAAHKTLRFGTRVRVTNLTNGRKVTVRINDRGPFVRGRVIDLSRAAASKIGMIGRGVARVRLEKLH